MWAAVGSFWFASSQAAAALPLGSRKTLFPPSVLQVKMKRLGSAVNFGARRASSLNSSMTRKLKGMLTAWAAELSPPWGLSPSITVILSLMNRC